MFDSRFRTLVAVSALCFGGFAASLTQTLLIPVQPDLPRFLDASPANASWAITVTLLVAAVAMPTVGRLADLFGKQPLTVVCLGFLLVGSMLCVIADSLPLMLTGRAMHGVAMGLIPVGISLIREISTPRMAATGIAAMSAMMGIGAGAGLPLAAWITEAAGWRWMFGLSALMAVISMVLTWIFVPRRAVSSNGRVDVVGAVVLTIGLISFLVGLSRSNVWGWDDPRTWTGLIAGIIVLALWTVLETRRREPLVDVRTMAKVPVLLTNAAAVAYGFGTLAWILVMPQLLQSPRADGVGLGQTMLEAGLWMAPGGLSMVVLAPVTSYLIHSIGASTTLIAGGVFLSVGYAFAIVFQSSPWHIMVVGIVISFGVGMGYAAMPTLILDAVPSEEAAAAVGVNALMRMVGMTLAAAVMSTILTNSSVVVNGRELPSHNAYLLCFIVGAAVALVASVLAVFIPRATTREAARNVMAPTPFESLS